MSFAPLGLLLAGCAEEPISMQRPRIEKPTEVFSDPVLGARAVNCIFQDGSVVDDASVAARKYYSLEAEKDKKGVCGDVEVLPAGVADRRKATLSFKVQEQSNEGTCRLDVGAIAFIDSGSSGPDGGYEALSNGTGKPAGDIDTTQAGYQDYLRRFVATYCELK